LTSELALRDDVDAINAAHTDPGIQVALAHAGDPDASPGSDGAAAYAGPPAPVDRLLEFSGLANGKHTSRHLSVFLWAQNSIRLSGAASLLYRAKVREGRLTGSTLPYVLIPMVAAFSINNAIFTRVLQNFLGITGHPFHNRTTVATPALCNSGSTTSTTSRSARPTDVL